METGNYKNCYAANGFVVIDDIFNAAEIDSILNEIESVNTDSPTFRKSNDLFAIRQFLKQVPAVVSLIFSTKLNEMIEAVFGKDFFVVKSIYFDKPEQSNWFVAYHQDLTISVENRMVVDGYGPWTVKQNQYAVQPPLAILENNFTIRIHLDDTDADNGALKVIPGSHKKGIVRPEGVGEGEVFCPVKKGAVMLMSPLLMHASNRTTNNMKRRVVHLEFSNQSLQGGLKWSEFLNWRN
jgi:hypothetical protein